MVALTFGKPPDKGALIPVSVGQNQSVDESSDPLADIGSDQAHGKGQGNQDRH